MIWVAAFGRKAPYDRLRPFRVVKSGLFKAADSGKEAASVGVCFGLGIGLGAGIDFGFGFRLGTGLSVSIDLGIRCSYGGGRRCGSG